jgi:DNA-binding transcriptional LysR family regulator
MDRLASMTVFARVVETGGFSAAARRLNMSTTMVSNHIQALEDHLGARLLHRTTRKVSVTEVGRLYYQRVSQILAELGEADRAAGAFQSTPTGTLRLHIGTHIARFVAPVIAEYLELYPEVSIEMITGERMVDMIEEGFDLVVRATPAPDSSLIVRNLVAWRHVLCCSPAYLETHEPPRSLADLAKHNCLRYAYYHYSDGWHFIDPEGKPVVAEVSGRLVTSNAETLRTVALAGLGVFLAPGFMIGDDIEAGRLVPLLPDCRPVEFAINAIYPHRNHMSAKVRAFIEMLAQRIAAYRRWMDPDAGYDARMAESADHRTG